MTVSPRGLQAILKLLTPTHQLCSAAEIQQPEWQLSLRQGPRSLQTRQPQQNLRPALTNSKQQQSFAQLSFWRQRLSCDLLPSY